MVYMYLLLLESKAVRDQNVKCLGENAEVCISAVSAYRAMVCYVHVPRK